MHDRHTRAQLSGPLADAFLAGPWNETALVIRAGQVLEPPPAWIDSLVRAVLAAYVRRPGDRPRELAAYIDLQLRAMRPVPGAPIPRVRRWLLAELAMGRRPWPVPALCLWPPHAASDAVAPRSLAARAAPPAGPPDARPCPQPPAHPTQ